MRIQLKSLTREPAAMDLEAAVAPTDDPIRVAVTTRPPSPMKDITDASRRRLVIGRSDRPLQPAAGMFVTETVLGLDERTRIVSTGSSPWKFICALDIDSPTGRFMGTGWVVGPRTLITAGHCVFDRNQMGGWAREIVVSPGQDRELRPFGSVTAARFSSLDRWIQDQDPDFDIAALHLDADLFGPDEGFQVGALPDADLRGSLLNVSGYPGAPGNGQEQWWAKNRIREVTARRIFYDVDTSGGQSGGPAYIFRDGAETPVVVGIHAYGVGGTPASIPMQVNSAPRIVPEVVEHIQAWIDASSGP